MLLFEYKVGDKHFSAPINFEYDLPKERFDEITRAIQEMANCGAAAAGVKADTSVPAIVEAEVPQMKVTSVSKSKAKDAQAHE